MRKGRFLLVLLALLLIVSSAQAEDATRWGDMALDTVKLETKSGRITEAVQPSNVYYISPDGSDLNPGTQEQPFKTLYYALSVLRNLKNKVEGDITFYLKGGYHRLHKTLIMTADDLNKADGGRISFKAAEGENPVISGGKLLENWEKATVNGVEGVYKTKVASVKYIRQLYAGNEPQTRAQFSTAFAWEWLDGRQGVRVPDADLSAIQNAGKMEIFWPTEWKVFILPVDRIEQCDVYFKQPYGQNFVDMIAHMTQTQNEAFYPNERFPAYLQNDLGLLDTPGEWYYDEAACELYYYPAAGVDMQTTPIFIPGIQSMIEIMGSAKNPVKNLSFEGITFAHGAWNEPSYQGLVINQAQNKVDITRSHSTQEISVGYAQISACITVDYADQMTLRDCVFENMGSTAISLRSGITNSLVEACIFRNTAEGGLVLSNSSAYDAQGAGICANNIIRNNVFRNIGLDYWSAPALTVYFAAGTQILHNDFYNLPYSGISLGWGWYFYHDSTVSRENVVAYNKIGKFLQRCRDGGGIYTLGQQPDSLVIENYIFDQGAAYGGLYHDEGSAYFTTERNVVDNIAEHDEKISWIHVNGGPGGPNGGKTTYNLEVHGNYYSNHRTSLWGEPSTCIVTDNLYVSNGEWPEEALKIMQQAGLEEEYKYLLEGW